MKYLFLFLKKQSFFFLFVFLELTALLLLANHNNFQKAGFINSSNIITGSFHSAFSSIGDYFFLKQANKQLVGENAQLNKLLQQFPTATDSLYGRDTTYAFIPARVISNTTRNRNNYIMINKGSNDGIEREMGLVSPQGVAGIIVEVSSHYATAMSLLHKDARISARLKNNGQMVNISWDGIDYRKGMLEDIPSHITPMAGDTVVTSGYSFLFPENLLIGVVGENVFKGGSLNRAELIFSTDFNNLYYVYVTKNKASAELDSLNMNLIDE